MNELPFRLASIIVRIKPTDFFEAPDLDPLDLDLGLFILIGLGLLTFSGSVEVDACIGSLVLDLSLVDGLGLLNCNGSMEVDACIGSLAVGASAELSVTRAGA